jgi:hypothetical protein
VSQISRHSRFFLALTLIESLPSLHEGEFQAWFFFCSPCYADSPTCGELYGRDEWETEAADEKTANQRERYSGHAGSPLPPGAKNHWT